MTLDSITGITVQERKRLLSWALRLPEADLMLIFHRATHHSFRIIQHLGEAEDRRCCKYAAFVVAAREAGWDSIKGKGYRIAGEKQFKDFSKVRELAASRQKRPPVLKRKVLAYWGVVSELKRSGHGFRAISAYLRRHHRLNVSVTYLAKLWREMVGGCTTDI